MMPDDLKTTRTDLNSVAVLLASIDHKFVVRTRVVVVVGVAVVAAVLVLTFFVRENAVATRENAVAIRENEQDRIAACERGRVELRQMAMSIVNGSADGLRDVAKASPRNQTPEAQALVDLFSEQYRQEYLDSVLAEVPSPADC